MKDIANYSYDDLVKLDMEVLSLEELEQLQEHELVTSFDNLGTSATNQFIGLDWFVFTIEVDDNVKCEINIYV